MKRNFSPSAIGCKRPRGPTRFGPTRSCTQAAIFRSIVRGLLARVRLDRVGDGVGLGRESRALPVIVGKAVYYFLLLLVLLGVLQILHLELISGPIQAMLNKITAALPNIFEALLILAMAWVIAVVLRTVFASVLARVRFDRVPLIWASPPRQVRG